MCYPDNMSKVSPKTVLCAVFLSWGVLYLGGCVEPISIASFAKSSEVAEIIEQSAGTVHITGDSDFRADLIEGNKKISGLKEGKYYMVEEWDETSIGDTPDNIQFVGANGERTNLAGIGKVSGEGGEITGLTNRYRYRVTVAKSLKLLIGSVTYSALTYPPGGSGTKTIDNDSDADGVIKLLGPTNDSTFIYTLNPPPTAYSYEIAEVPISADGTAAGPARSALRSSNDGIITVITQGTKNDYVYLGSDEDGIHTGQFWVLTVVSDPDATPPEPTEEGDLNITVSFTLNAADKTFTLSDNSAIFSQAGLLLAPPHTISVTLTNAYPTNPFDTGSIKWTYNAGQPDEQIWPGDTLSIDFTNAADEKFLVIGYYTITIEAAVGGVPYKAVQDFVLEITP